MPDEPRGIGFGRPVLQGNALGQLPERILRDPALHPGLVGLGDFVPGMRQVVSQFPIVG